MEPGGVDLNENLGEISEADRLLCRLIRLEPDSITGVDTIGEEKWSPVIQCAERMELAGVLYNRLKMGQEWDRIPEETRVRLYRGHLVNGTRGLIFQHSLNQLLSAFSRRGLPVIVLKGAFLAEAIYADLSERMMGDIDLLAPKASFDLAVDVLRSEGYRSQLQYPAEEGFLFTKSAPSFQKEWQPAIDMHWDLVSPDSPFHIDLEGVWQRARKVDVASSSTLSLSREDLLLYLCVHGIVHRLRLDLRVIYDIAMTVNTYSNGLDWEAFISRAQSWNVDRSTYLLLRLAIDLFGASVPQSVLSSIQPVDYDPAFLIDAYSLLILNESQRSILQENLVKWHDAIGLKDKMLIIIHRVFPPITEISFQFGVSPRSWRAWLYYPLRWFYLFTQYFDYFGKLSTGNKATIEKARASTERYNRERKLFLWLTSSSQDK